MEYSDPPKTVPTKFRLYQVSLSRVLKLVKSTAYSMTLIPEKKYGGYQFMVRMSLLNFLCLELSMKKDKSNEVKKEPLLSERLNPAL